MKVRAVVIPRPHTVELRELELIEPVSTDVIVRTAYSSISAGTISQVRPNCFNNSTRRGLREAR